MAAALLLLLAAMIVGELARRVRGARAATRRNRAMHELRRPLQSISLALARPSPDLDCVRACLAQARGAVDGLDAAINSSPPARNVVSTTLAELVAALERRWRGRDVDVRVPREAVALRADPVEIGSALDNLVANSLIHGSGPVTVCASAGSAEARIEVRDEGSARELSTIPGDPRHGHGLGVAADAAESHGGSVLIARPAGGRETLAALSLPCETAVPPARSPRGPAG